MLSLCAWMKCYPSKRMEKMTCIFGLMLPFLLTKSVITESKMIQESAFMICSDQHKRLIPWLFSFLTYPSKVSSLSSIHLKFRLKLIQDCTSSAFIFTFKEQSTKIISTKREYHTRTHESTSFQCVTSFFQQYL